MVWFMGLAGLLKTESLDLYRWDIWDNYPSDNYKTEDTRSCARPII